MAAAHLAADPNVLAKTGRILLTADLAREYGFVDTDGKINADMRQLNRLVARGGWRTLASFIPNFVRVPHFLFYFGGYKF